MRRLPCRRWWWRWRTADRTAAACFRRPDARTIESRLRFSVTRLAILDVAAGAGRGRPRAPCITYNGEAYNFLALKRELEARGAHFANQTDTEVLLRGYDAWGVDVLPRLRGMFAFGLWDQANRRLLLARDRLGIKPLYYFKADGALLFASEIRALLATGLVPRKLDATALWQYLGYQSVPAPRTLVEGVRVLDAGSWLLADETGRTSSGQYWNMLDRRAGPAPSVDPQEIRRTVSDLLRDAVTSHLVSDVPVGAFLSGGIDSGAVVGLMREAGVTPRTFSVGFAERAFDESAHAALVAKKFAADHTHIRLDEHDLLGHLPGALRAMDLPTGDGVNSYVISEAVRARGVTVALSGLGGDEIFGGYPSFSRLARVADVSRIWGRSPDAIRSLAASAVRAIGRSSVPATKAAAVLETDGSLSAMFPLMRQVLSLEQRLALVDDHLLADIADRSDPYDRFLADAFAQAPASSLFARISFAEARTYMHDVLLRDTDQMSMAHSPRSASAARPSPRGLRDVDRRQRETGRDRAEAAAGGIARRPSARRHRAASETGLHAAVRAVDARRAPAVLRRASRRPRSRGPRPASSRRNPRVVAVVSRRGPGCVLVASLDSRRARRLAGSACRQLAAPTSRR